MGKKVVWYNIGDIDNNGQYFNLVSQTSIQKLKDDLTVKIYGIPAEIIDQMIPLGWYCHRHDGGILFLYSDVSIECDRCSQLTDEDKVQEYNGQQFCSTCKRILEEREEIEAVNPYYFETLAEGDARIKKAEEDLNAMGWFEAGGIGFFSHNSHPDFWLDLNSQVICIFHKNHKHTGECDDYPDGFAYTAQEVVSWLQEHEKETCNTCSGNILCKVKKTVPHGEDKCSLWASKWTKS